MAKRNLMLSEIDIVQIYKDYWKVYKTVKNLEKKKHLDPCENLIKNFVNKWYYKISKPGFDFLAENMERVVTMHEELNNLLEEKRGQKCKTTTQQQHNH